MAEWNNAHNKIPQYVYKLQREPPPTLITRFEDGTETRREKTTVAPRRIREKYSVNRATLKLMLDFFHAKGLAVAFTRISYDARDASYGVTEMTCRFESAPSYDTIAEDTNHISFDFIEVF